MQKQKLHYALCANLKDSITHRVYKLQFISLSPQPPPRPGRGNKLLLLLEFSAGFQLETQQAKVIYSPSPVGEGVRGRGL